jgi:hypothetical protein
LPAIAASAEKLAVWAKKRDNRGNFGKAGETAMADHIHSRFDAQQRKQVAERIKRYLHEIGLSRKKLVRHDLKLSTINKALTGQFSDGTLAKLEAILGCRFEPEESRETVPSEAPVALGGYSLSTSRGLPGRYLCAPKSGQRRRDNRLSS